MYKRSDSGEKKTRLCQFCKQEGQSEARAGKQKNIDNERERSAKKSQSKAKVSVMQQKEEDSLKDMSRLCPVKKIVCASVLSNREYGNAFGVK